MVRDRFYPAPARRIGRPSSLSVLLTGDRRGQPSLACWLTHSGKSTIGHDLSVSLSLPFIDGDTLHPASNIDKMTRGIPLTDDDRLPWLALIRSTAERVCRDEWEMEHSPKSSRRTQTSTEEHDPESQHGDVETDDRSKPLREQDKAIHWREDWKGIRSVKDGGIGRPGVVIACSALRRWYRDILRGEIEASPPEVDDLVSGQDQQRAMASLDGSFVCSALRPCSLRSMGRLLANAIHSPHGMPPLVVVFVCGSTSTADTPASRQPDRHPRPPRPPSRDPEPPHPLCLLPRHTATASSTYRRSERPLYGRPNACVAARNAGRPDKDGRDGRRGRRYRRE